MDELMLQIITHLPSEPILDPSEPVISPTEAISMPSESVPMPSESVQIPSESTASEISQLSDKELYALCQEYGQKARVWKRKFAGLLPEVMHRQLYRRRGFGSIYEFAFKLGGLSQNAVDKVLHLAERLADKPALRAQLETGSQGWSKIERVSYIATPQTDRAWAEKVETLSKPALESYIQEKMKTENPADCTKNKNDQLFLPGQESNTIRKTMQVWGSMTFPVSPEVEKSVRLLKYQLEKENKVPLTFNEVLETLLKAQGSKEAKVVIQVCPECAARRATEAKTRTIPIMVRRYIQAQYQGFCGFQGCLKPATSLHHTKRYALNPSHDPNGIVPLCTAHERLVHSGLIENEEDPPNQWRLLNKPQANHPKFRIDQAVQKHRRELC